MKLFSRFSGLFAGGWGQAYAGFSVFILIAVLAVLLFDVIYNGTQVISGSFSKGEFFTAGDKAGMLYAIIGTLALTLFTVVLMVPSGVLFAVYLAEYAPDNYFTAFLKLLIANLAGVPSIVLGMFGLGFLVFFLGDFTDNLLGLKNIFGKPSILWAAVTLAFLNLPTVILTSYESLKNIPESVRLSAYSLGATREQMFFRTLLPQARPGIITGIILAVARTMGETAPILFLGVVFFMPEIPVTEISFGLFTVPLINPLEQFMALPYTIFILATQSTVPGENVNIEYMPTLILLLLTIAANLLAIKFRYRYEKVIGKLR